MLAAAIPVLALAAAITGQGLSDEPFPAHRVIGNVYYVGSKDLASYLITTPEGHILINSGFEETVPIIRAAVESLGFSMRDIKVLLASHAHGDHVAGLALAKRLTGAKVSIMRGDDAVVASGGQGQYFYTKSRWKPCAVDRVLDDGDEVKLAGVTLVARRTPGHTRGCTTWTWRAADGGKTYHVVVVGSPNVNPGFQLVDNPDYPEIATDFAKTFQILKALPCDVFLGAHGNYYGMIGKYQRSQKKTEQNPFVDPEGYRAFVALKEKNFRATLAQQRAAKGAAPVLPLNTPGALDPGRSARVVVPPAPTDRTLSVLVALDQPGRLTPGSPVTAAVIVSGATLTKVLHLGDPDVLWSIRQPKGMALTVDLKVAASQSAPVAYTVRVAELGSAAGDGVAFETEPNDSPETANPLTLGQTVYGLADDRPAFPLGAQSTVAEQSAGLDWFRFEFASEAPRLAFFALDFVDRDLPPDVRIYRLQNGRLSEYTTGIDPQSLQRERPPRPGANKFTTRVLTKGTYYVQVDACQPDYQLRTKLFDVPPYLKPGEPAAAEQIAAAAQQAVRVALDFQLLAGDSWHANTPRRGHAMDRVANFHHETSTCIACHPTHFTTQSALAANRSGYRVEQPFALRFLTDRLANNPVPFHGYPEAVWARMISAPANVLGRLSTLLMDYEDQIAGHPRDNTHRAIAEFLKLYYDGRAQLPPDETNGNNPVSRYKVASDSWRQLDAVFRRTGDARYAQTRDLVARFLPTGKPAHTRDLAAQTIGLCTADRAGFAPKIDANVQRLLHLQRPNGHWSVKFDPNYAITEMQTGESLYALALAGLPAEHPAMRAGTVALLTVQKPFGGWFDISPYEQFRTPFRETQWSLIALSRLYPGPGTQRWDGPLGPQAETLNTSSASRLIGDLERIWDQPPTDLSQALIAQLEHELPLVRYAACTALSRCGDGQAVDPLIRRLGDESKVVRRAAAEALRAVGNRLNAAKRPGETGPQVHYSAALGEALRAPDDRTRRGATRIFAAHFRDLAQELGLADALLLRLDDPDPVVQLQAIKGLWRWWYWRAEDDLRNKIEDRLIAQLAEPGHPWVRRNLIEALYIIGDENIRYLYNNWVPALATQERRDRATAAQHATTNRLGAKYVRVLDQGGPYQREGVLRAMSEFFERPAVQTGRVGNDTEPMLFSNDALPRVSAALTRQLADSDPTIRRLALQALVTLRRYRDPALARAIAARQGDASAAVRTWAVTMAKEFPVEILPGRADPALLAMLDELVHAPLPEAQVAALSILGRIGPMPQADRSPQVESRLTAPAAPVRAAALRAAASFPKLLASRALREPVARELSDADPEARVAAIQLVLRRPELAAGAALRQALDDATAEHRTALLAAVTADKALALDLRLVGVISGSLVDGNRGVREKALQVIQTHPQLVANPAVEDGLRELTRSDNQRQKEIARALLTSRGRSSSAQGGGELLDVAYFEAKVLSVFSAVGEDGQSCMGCHRSHTILKMVGPGKDGRWSPEAVRANFRAALRVVNLASPGDSLLLGKPTWEAAAEAEAQKDPTIKAHTGGVRFEKGSREYQALLDWINGARLRSTSEQIHEREFEKKNDDARPS